MDTVFYAETKIKYGWGQQNLMRLGKLKVEDLRPVVRLANKKKLCRGETPVLFEDEAMEALRQYYALPILEYPRQQFAISTVVDEYWHWHVLDTRGWQDFCYRIYGRMMHHVPLDPDDYYSSTRVWELYTETRELLIDHFGNSVSERAYPPVRNDGDIVATCYSATNNLFD